MMIEIVLPQIKQLILLRQFLEETCSSRKSKSTNLPGSSLGNWDVKHITEFQQFLFVTFIKFFFNFNLLLILQDNKRIMETRTESGRT